MYRLGSGVHKTHLFVLSIYMLSFISFSWLAIQEESIQSVIQRLIVSNVIWLLKHIGTYTKKLHGCGIMSKEKMQVSIKRVPTGIPGLDDLIEGGFPEGSVNVVSGPAGGAKSLFSMSFLYNGIKEYNQAGLYISLEESKENLLKAMACYGMNIPKYEDAGKLFVVDLGGMAREGVGYKEDLERKLVGFETLTNFITVFLAATPVKRIVIDSITAVGLYYKSLEELRQEMFRFVRFLKESKVTAILITESTTQSGETTRYGIEQFVADSFIVLSYEKKQGEFRRAVSVLKMRMTKHDSGTHPFLITSSGIEVSSEIEL